MNIHQIYLVGRSTKDAEKLESKAGKSYTKFSLAVNEYRGKDKDSKAYYYDVLVFGTQADAALERVAKGDSVIVFGKPEVDAYISKKSKEAKGTITVLAESWKVLK